MSDHTPTPWVVEGASIYTAAVSEPRYVMETAPRQNIGSLSSPRGPSQRDVDAAFIVKAVNAHDALVRALKTAREWISEGAHSSDPDLAEMAFADLARVDAALSKAVSPTESAS